MKMYLRQFVFLIVILSVLISCDDDSGCDLELPHDNIELVFYDIESLEETSYNFNEISVFYEEEEGRLVFYTSEDSASSTFAMQVNPSMDSITYVFGTGVSRDTLRLSYHRDLIWVSDKCGPFMNYDGLEILNSTFDSVSLINNVIDASIDENIQIYR